MSQSLSDHAIRIDCKDEDLEALKMTKPLWALAAGCVPDALPWDIPRIAHDAGFLSSGMWVDPKTTWGADALMKTRSALSDTGIQLVDVEVGWLEEAAAAGEAHKLLVDVALELGARNLLIVSRHPDLEASIRQFREICDRANAGLRVCLEFGEFTSIKSLSAAKEFIRKVDHPRAGILIDLMHLNRSGEALPDLDDARFPYIQACDFYQASAGMTGRDYIRAAVDDRCCLGEGEGRLGDIIGVAHSGKDVSLEIRSKALRTRFSDPWDRGAEIFKNCQRSLGASV